MNFHEEPLETSLLKHFNYRFFRLGQKEIIKDIFRGKDVLGILPTGSGKSLCYQLPAKILEGSTIVVSPLISLMMDQVNELKATNFKDVVAINSFMNPREKRHVYQKLSTYKLIYVSPELLQQNELLSYLKQIQISLFVIDEAHCISQWGHEFRPDYLKLNSVMKLLKDPPTLALSATATTNVQEDIMEFLEKPKITKHIYPIDRKNIAFYVREVLNNQEKVTTIVNLLSKNHVPTLVYFSSRKSAEKTAKTLAMKLPKQRIAFYHGGMDQIDRISIQQQFMNDQLDVICCTSAFGMGINKNNIRLVIHYHFSSQLESYIQEVGRAGRDGNSSLGLLLYSKKDAYLPMMLINNELPTESELTFVFQELYKLSNETKALPASEYDVKNILQVNEVKWRFLHYQIEKSGMIKENTIIYNKRIWKQAFHDINNYREKRFLLKQTKLNEMMDWIQEKECFRKHLYKNFQHSYTHPLDKCCSNCGFSLSEWKPEQLVGRDESSLTWDRKLRALLIGANNETK